MRNVILLVGIISFVLAPSLSSSVYCYLPLQPFQAIKLRKQPIGFMHVFTILQVSLLLHNDGFNFFNIVDRPNSVYLHLKGLVHFWFIPIIYLLYQERYSFVNYLL
jgi:hypothetical protein